MMLVFWMVTCLIYRIYRRPVKTWLFGGTSVMKGTFFLKLYPVASISLPTGLHLAALPIWKMLVVIPDINELTDLSITLTALDIYTTTLSILLSQKIYIKVISQCKKLPTDTNRHTTLPTKIINFIMLHLNFQMLWDVWSHREDEVSPSSTAVLHLGLWNEMAACEFFSMR